MKNGIYIIILFSFGLLLFACRSTRHSNIQSDYKQSAQKESAVVRKDSTRTESSYQDSTAAATNILEYTRTTAYRDNGTISGVQEQWRHTGSAQLSVSSGRSSEVSINEGKEEIKETANEQRKEVIKEDSVTDSRPIQGSDWLWIGIALLIFFCLIILFK